MKLEKYQQDKVMIIVLVVYQIFTGCFISKQKALDADSRAIQQIIFTGKITATQNNTRIIIYYILKQSKETILDFSKETIKFR